MKVKAADTDLMEVEATKDLTSMEVERAADSMEVDNANQQALQHPQATSQRLHKHRKIYRSYQNLRQQ